MSLTMPTKIIGAVMFISTFIWVYDAGLPNTPATTLERLWLMMQAGAVALVVTMAGLITAILIGLRISTWGQE